MDLKTQDGMFLISQAEKERNDTILKLAQKIKNKYFSVGRDIAALSKLIPDKKQP